MYENLIGILALVIFVGMLLVLMVMPLYLVYLANTEFIATELTWNDYSEEKNE